VRFCRRHVEFLGPKLSAASTEPLRSHVQAVLTHPETTTIRKLQAFLGTVNFYRGFLPAASKPAGSRILKPLTDLLISGSKGTAPISPHDPQRVAFVAAKQALAAAAHLAHPTQGFQLSLTVDASAEHICGALQQRRHEAAPWHP